jgi:hypothetical protein
VAVDLLLHLTRSTSNHVSGTVRTISGSEIRTFSGTLELMWVFEELVPVSDDALQSPEPGDDPASPDSIDQ